MPTKSVRACVAVESTQFADVAEYNKRRMLQGSSCNGLYRRKIGETKDVIAEEFGVNSNYITKAHKLKIHAPHIFASVRDGDMSINDAWDLFHERQVQADIVTYFMVNVTVSHIKVGKTNNLRSRHKTIQGANSSLIVVVGWVNGDVELMIHRHCEAYHVRGEWFTFGSAMADFVSTICDVITEDGEVVLLEASK